MVKKVFVVTCGYDGGFRTITATEDMALAERVREKFSTPADPAFVVVYECAESLLRQCWRVRFHEDGSVRGVKDCSINPLAYEDLGVCRVFSDVCGGTYGIEVYVLSDNAGDAIKVASEKRMEWLNGLNPDRKEQTDMDNQPLEAKCAEAEKKSGVGGKKRWADMTPKELYWDSIVHGVHEREDICARIKRYHEDIPDEEIARIVDEESKKRRDNIYKAYELGAYD